MKPKNLKQILLSSPILRNLNISQLFHLIYEANDEGEKFNRHTFVRSKGHEYHSDNERVVYLAKKDIKVAMNADSALGARDMYRKELSLIPISGLPFFYESFRSAESIFILKGQHLALLNDPNFMKTIELMVPTTRDAGSVMMSLQYLRSNGIVVFKDGVFQLSSYEENCELLSLLSNVPEAA